MPKYQLEEIENSFSNYELETFGDILILLEEGEDSFSKETKKRVHSSYSKEEGDRESYFTNIVRIHVNGNDNIAEYDVLSLEGNILYTDWVYLSS